MSWCCVIDYFKKMYGSFNKACKFEFEEFNRESGKFLINYEKFLDKSVYFDNMANAELVKFNNLKKDVKNRFWKNLGRIISGKDLLQEVEEMAGVKYGFIKHGFLRVVDEDKRVKVTSDFKARHGKKEYGAELEKYLIDDVVNNIKNMANSNNKDVGIVNSCSRSNCVSSIDFVVKSNGSSFNAKRGIDSVVSNNADFSNYSNVSKGNSVGAVDNFTALYIDSYKSDCFTNQIAEVSSFSSGPVKGVADVLAGYVQSKNSNLVSPHLRSWKSRISNLEKTILSNNFSSKDKEFLLKIKGALSKNHYLVNKKSELYEKAVSLIDSAIGRDYVEVS